MRLGLTWLLVGFLLAGCSARRTPVPTPTPTDEPTAVRTETPTATATCRPTERPPTLTPTVSTPTPLPTLTPTPIPMATDDLNVLLLGSDHRSQQKDASWRTDVLIVVAIRPRAKRVAMFSVPRDLWVTIPDYGESRINVADYLGELRGGPGGGPKLLGATLEQNLGIPINAYVRVDFEGVERIIDTLGGVTITSDRAFDEWMQDSNGEKLLHMQVISGTQHMDGRTALQYARSRIDTSDLDRSRRQQQILLAARDAALRPETLPRLPALLVQLSDTVDTNLRPDQLLSLIELGIRLGHESYRGRVFDKTMVSDWITPQGAMVLLPKREGIDKAWNELLAP